VTGRFAETGRQRTVGHDRTDPLVTSSPDYSPIGWAFVLIGISWPPRSVAFSCTTCGSVFERVTDPQLIKELAVIS